MTDRVRQPPQPHREDLLALLGLLQQREERLHGAMGGGGAG